jgi:hypothetical protein
MIAPGAPVKTVPFNQPDPTASGQPTDVKSEPAK